MANIEDYLHPKERVQETQRMGLDRQIRAIILAFNFNIVRNCMVWKNEGSDIVPSTAESIIKATGLLMDVWDITENDSFCAIYSGGFVARRFITNGIKRLELSFEIESWNVTHEEASTIDG